MKRPSSSQSSSQGEELPSEELLEEAGLAPEPLPDLHGEWTNEHTLNLAGQWQLTRLPTVWLMGFPLVYPEDTSIRASFLQQAWKEFSDRQLLRRIPGQQTERVICLTRKWPSPESPALHREILVGAEVDPETPVVTGMEKWSIPSGLFFVFQQQEQTETQTTNFSTQQAPHLSQEEWETLVEQAGKIDSLKFREGIAFERYDLNRQSPARIFLPVQLAN